MAAVFSVLKECFAFAFSGYLEVVQKMFAGGDDFSTAAWMVAVSMVMGTILILSCLSCLLIYKEGRHGAFIYSLFILKAHMLISGVLLITPS